MADILYLVVITLSKSKFISYKHVDKEDATIYAVCENQQDAEAVIVKAQKFKKYQGDTFSIHTVDEIAYDAIREDARGEW